MQFSHYVDHQTRLFGHLLGQFVRIALLDDDPLDAGVDDHFRADDAGLRRAVQRASLDAAAHAGRLDDGVLLRVQAPAQLVHLAGGHVELLAQAAGLFAVPDALGYAVVAGGDDAVILYDDRPHPSAQAGAALTGELRHFHEVLIPSRSVAHRSTPLSGTVPGAAPCVRPFPGLWMR